MDGSRRWTHRGRQALTRTRARSGAVAGAVGRVLVSEREELTVLLGIVLLSAGLATAVSPAAAAIVAGLVLLWVGLPQRQPFVKRPTVIMKPTRRKPLEE
jgi:hypothetical protein